jgi:uncharacterized protein (TIGR03437 family)
MRLKWMVLPLAVFAFVGAASTAFGQTLALSYNGSGTSPDNSNSISGTGTGTFAGGASTVTFTGLTGGGGQCDNSLLFSLKETAANGTDSLTTSFYAANGASGGDSQASLTVPGVIAVTGGTGIYAGKGGSGTGTFSVNINKATSTFTFTFTGSVTLAGSLAPIATVNPSGVVPVNSDLAYVQSASWVSIYGSNLATATTLWNGDFPTSLGSVTATFDGKPGYLWFVSASQINVQIPDDTKTGCIAVVVNTPNGTVNSTVDLEPFAPSLNVITGSNGKSYAAAVILTPNGTGAYGGGTYDIMGPTGNFPYSTRPAHRGDIVELFGVGFGPTQTTVHAGQLFSGASATTIPVQVFTNVTQTSGTQFPVSFAGLVGAGLYQITVTIPQGASTGDSPMQVLVGTPTQGSSNTNNGISNDLTIYMSVQ